MAVFAKPATLANKIVDRALAVGQSRHADRDSGKIHSIGTARAYKQALKLAATWGKEQRHRDLNKWTPEIAHRYLESRSSQVGQKTLDRDRQALQILAKLEKLDRIKSTYTPERKLAEEGRAYSPKQVAALVAVQSPKNALATEIASAAGLRAHELLTLRPAAEHSASTHREWSPERFTGIEGERYTVTGKGGLVREVVIPADLAERLEAVRLAEPVRVTDRGIHYQQAYDIGGGWHWSRSITRVSKSVLGYSSGAHGLRHGYAQRRIDSLQSNGRLYEDALLIVSQELGHFRPEITEVYLR